MMTEDGDDLAGLIPERADSNTVMPALLYNAAAVLLHTIICHQRKFERPTAYTYVPYHAVES